MVDVDESQLSPGKLLLQGRLQAGLTQEQVAKELYMTVPKVNALETDDYGSLSSDTFARGYIRAYANMLKVDVVNVLNAYERQIQMTHGNQNKTNTNGSPKNSANKSTHKGTRGTWQFLGFLAVFFVGLWLISVWFFDNRNETEHVLLVADSSSLAANIDNLPASNNLQSFSSSPSQGDVVGIVEAQSSTAAIVVVPTTPAAITSSVTSSSIVSDATSKVVAENSAIESANKIKENVSDQRSLAVVSTASSENVKVESTTKKSGLDEINFSFRSESWLEVSDSRGDVLATELQAEGSTLALVGKAPFDVKLGNAPAVDIRLNGKKIDVIPLLGSNVLTMKIGN